MSIQKIDVGGFLCECSQIHRQGKANNPTNNGADADSCCSSRYLFVLNRPVYEAKQGSQQQRNQAIGDADFVKRVFVSLFSDREATAFGTKKCAITDSSTAFRAKFHGFFKHSDVFLFWNALLQAYYITK